MKIRFIKLIFIYRKIIPAIFYDLINFENLKMDKSMLPLLTSTWSSNETLNVLLTATKSLNYSETYIKLVRIFVYFIEINLFKKKIQTLVIVIFN